MIRDSTTATGLAGFFSTWVFSHRYSDISWAITAKNSPPHIASSQTRTGNLWFPEPLRSLKPLSYIAYQWLWLLGYFLVTNHVSQCSQITQWLELVHSNHKVMHTNPTRANFLYGREEKNFKIKKAWNAQKDQSIFLFACLKNTLSVACISKNSKN